MRPALHRPHSADGDERTRADWIEEFEAAARRRLAQRMRYAFIKTYKPVLDDAPFSRLEFDRRISRLVRA